MRVLVIEDLQLKIDELTKYLENDLQVDSITVRKSYNSGLDEVLFRSAEYDLIILDMSMQNYDISQNEPGGDPINLAGLNILDQMYFREIPNKVIVFTMYGNFEEVGVSLFDLHEQLSKDFSENYLGNVFFNGSDDTWKDEMNKIIFNNNILKNNDQDLNS
ncbi:hypothetical protein [Pedobacter psychrodurus]|uniref:hypothetical protein n=1 Tax=Pedobacter psychrodurus TaxID=2530456 RepID=UPI00292E1DB4|nr:hypothetical protein [Pedobacter psychrodurus]